MAPAIYRPQKTGWHGRERLFVTLSLLRCHSIELHFLFHLSRLNSFTHCSFSLYVQENHFLLASRPAHNTTRLASNTHRAELSPSFFTSNLKIILELRPNECSVIFTDGCSFIPFDHIYV
uniref:Uncharacterized protein n=1 Tax=Salix viminalis TaxID=40686 RepID=A0A6N2K2U1_SALVM